MKCSKTWHTLIIIGGSNIGDFLNKITNRQSLLLTNISSYMVYTYIMVLQPTLAHACMVY